ncbi:MAG: DUF4214 domain-containing protein [Gemmataceae bacterium]|nr:DUF4214 domain-containing protein [Gemmataceae bacterium]
MRTLFSSWLGRRTRKAQPARGQFRRRPEVEALEERTVPSITNPLPTVADPGPVTLTGTNRPDQLVIRLQDSSQATTPGIQFSDNGGSSFVTAPLAAVTEVIVNGGGGKDALTLDLDNGLIGNDSTDGLPISFDGGPGGDVLNLVGDPDDPDDPDDTLTETFTLGLRSSPNTLTLSNGTVATTITLIDGSAIVDSVPATDFIFNGNDNNNQLHIQSKTHQGQSSLIIKGVNAQGVDDLDDDDNDDNDNDNDQGDDNDQDDEDVLGSINANAFRPLTLSNKTNVTVNGLGGDDLFVANIGAVPEGLESLTLDGGDGTNVLVGRPLPAGLTVTLLNLQRQDNDEASSFINRIYADQLNRPADVAGLNHWKGILNSSGRGAVIRGIEQSLEGRTNLVRNWYRQFLGREVDDAGLSYWVGQRLIQGASEEEVQAGILGSAEFLQRAQGQFNSGDPNENFLRAVYRLLLKRDLDPAGLAFWGGVVQTFGREAVGLGVMQSQEFRTLALATFYETLLERDLDEAGSRYWMNLPGNLDDVRQGIQESDEFFKKS